jgi:hypothetical protein
MSVFSNCATEGQLTGTTPSIEGSFHDERAQGNLFEVESDVCTRLRMSELFALKWSDVNFES